MRMYAYQSLFIALIGLLTTLAPVHSIDEVTLSLAEFEALYSSAKLKDDQRRSQDQRTRHEQEHKEQLSRVQRQHQSLFPENYQVLDHTATGFYNASSDVAVFDMQLTLRILDSQWTKVPLLSNSTVASDWNIQTWTEKDSFYPVAGFGATPDVLLLRDQQPTLATNRSGLFQIQFKSYSRVVKTRNIHQLTMSQFLYPITDFSLSVAPSAAREFSVQPVEAVLDVQPAEDATTVNAILPLTADRVEIRWLDATEPVGEKAVDGNEQNKTKQQKRKGEDEPPEVTVSHDVLHSIDEGMIHSSHVLEFTSTANELSAPMSFVVHGHNTRIASVEGHAVQKWEITDTVDDAKTIRLVWKSSHLDSTATVLVHTESDRSSLADEQVELPRIECRGVLRQVGHLGISKEANVEVHERLTKGGMTRCDANEIPSQLRLNMNRPIVLSYKYLNPKNATVVLDVHEHVAMDTLEATVDRVHYKAVVTDTHIVHSFMIVLQSTKLQYLELAGLPESASMFTLLVNSVPAKPVEGKDQSILVPLLVGLNPEAATEGRSLLTSVEVSYISSHSEPLGHNGTISLAPPYLELPISVLTMHLRLPTKYNYKFAGDFEAPARDLAFPVPPSYSYQTGKRVIDDHYTFSFKDDVWPDDDVKPQESSVKIVTPNTGRSYYFHRLLVLDTELALNATYIEPVEKKQKGWRERLLSLIY